MFYHGPILASIHHAYSTAAEHVLGQLCHAPTSNSHTQVSRGLLLMQCIQVVYKGVHNAWFDCSEH